MFKGLSMKLSLSIRKRPSALPYSEVVIPVGSIIISLLVSEFILIVYGVEPLILFNVLWRSFLSFSSIRYAIPLILSGVGLAIAYRANVWNIGAEGQILAGALIASGLALYYIPKELNPVLSWILLYSSAFISGAFLALIAALLKAKYDVNEVLSTLMLNYVMMHIVNYFVYGPWRGRYEYGYPRTDMFPPNTRFPQLQIFGIKTTVNTPTLILAIIFPFILYIILYRSKIGYEIRVVGSNPDAAEYGGISKSRVIILSMLISGGLAGIAGAGEVLGVYGQLIRAERVSAGFGYTAIIVAWLGKLNPIGALVAGYFLGILVSAGYTLQILSRVPYGMVNILTGTLLISLISLDFLSKYTPKIEVIR